MRAMPATKWRHRLLMGGCAVVACGVVVSGAARAQSLDMDASPTTPAATPAAGARQSGELDMDVNPSAPVAATAAPAANAPAAQPGGPASPIQSLTKGANVQDGIRQVNPGAAEGQPNAAASLTEAAPTAVAPAPAPVPAPATTLATTTTPVPAASPPAPSSGAGWGTVAAPGTPGQATTSTQTPDGAPPATAGASPAEPVSLDHPTVVDTATLKAGDTAVRLFGIDGVQGEEAQNLQGFLASTDDHLTCQAQTGSAFVCLLSDGTDVAQAALINGAARATDDAPDAYRAQEAAAQAARRGIWASLPPPPATVAHPAVRDTATLVADNQTYVLDGLHGLGAPYAAQMQSYIAANGDSLSCSPQDTPGHYICVLGDGTDIAKVALVNGAAVVASDAPDSYRLQQLDALNNHRGIWVNPPPSLLVASAPVAPPPELVLVAGDDGGDGITYVGGVPEAVIGGAAVFLVFGGDAGWGYYDGGHHWHDAPYRYRAHMEHYHPYGHGLRGYHEVSATGHVEGTHGGEVHSAGGAGGVAGHAAVSAGGHPTTASGAHYGTAAGAPAVHSGAPAVHSGAAGVHPGATGGTAGGVAGGTGHYVAPGARPVAANTGFVHPGPSAAGFHPAGVTPHPAAAPVAHASTSSAPAVKHH